MRLLFLTFAALALLAGPARAEHTGAGQIHDITVKVNGLVCDFCAQALKKVFGKISGVENVDVNLDTHEVILVLADNTDIPDEEVRKLITDSGYNVVEIIRAKS